MLTANPSEPPFHIFGTLVTVEGFAGVWGVILISVHPKSILSY